ncbi:unnamed protein product [Phytophthora lilii]|uniref:Unnamed protein product n=1 Tax=Phytophthora lilii TaxID=2077276 RepID=A0A9W6WLN3_9STRA|nr:unnamed protein product [Phytophthora lilii]
MKSDSNSVLEGKLTLKFELEQRADRQSKEMLKMMKSLMVTVVRASKTTVEKLPPWFLPSDELKFEPEAFAQGSFGSVHHGVWGSGTKVAVKCFLIDDIMTDERAKQKILFFFEAEMNIWPPSLGLEYIHNRREVHGDLKLNNALVGSDGQARRSDFEMSVVKTSSASIAKTASVRGHTSGGLRWRAPECLAKRPTFASDVYSFAKCIIEAQLNEPPFAFLDDDDVRENLKSGVIPDRPEEMPDRGVGIGAFDDELEPS